MQLQVLIVHTSPHTTPPTHTHKHREVYTSKYGKVRIYKVRNISKKSKAWVADPKNRLCDAPGSWYCPGQYPPDLPERTAAAGSGHATLNYAAHGM